MPRLALLKAARASGPDSASTRERLSLLIGDRRGLIGLLAVCSILSGFTEAATLALVAQLAASVLRTAHSGAHVHTLSLLNIHAGNGTLILVAFGFAVLRLLFQIPLSVLPARISAAVLARLRTELFDSFSRASWTVQSQGREGKLQEVMTNQVQQAVLGVTGTTGLITSGLQFVVLMVSALLLNVVAAIIVGAMTVVLFGLLRPMRARGGRYAQSLSQAQVQYAGGIAEHNRLAEETHVFDAGEAQRRRVGAAVGRAQHWYFRAQVLSRLVSNVYQSLIYLLLVAGIWAIYLIGGSHAGALGGVVLVLLRAGMAGQLIQGSYQTLIQAIPFVERAQETLTDYRDSAEPDGGEGLPSIDRVRFEHVSFAYNEQAPVLSDVSFSVSGGESIGIVGPSGAGKSTLLQLLLRLRRPDAGAYLINGVEVERFARSDWYRHVSYVPQEPRLLHASVADNIRFFRDIDDEQIERAARLARIHDDIIGWPEQYGTIVGPRADAVSGGQQQRICLARALAAEPDVLILDEPTSALDPESEAQIGASLQALRSNLTLFIVAHRMSTLEMCDRIIVIVDGRMAGFDTKAALQRENPYYRRASELASAGNGNRSGGGQPGLPPRPGEASGLAGAGPSRAGAGGGSPALEHGAIDLTPPPDPLVGAIPDFFIVGHPKCGTTALYEMLRVHPEIFMPERKEPWFFGEELHQSVPPRPGGTPRTLSEYAEWFAGAAPGQVVGEASAYYLWSQTAAANIARVNPDARIIAILREPASFLFSLHLQLLEQHTEVEKDFASAIALERDRREGRSVPRYTYWPQMLLYSEFIHYVEQLERVYAAFPAENVKILIYDDFRADNERVVREVRRFLGVEESGAVPRVQANPTVRPRSQVLNEAVHAVGIGRGPVSHAVKEAIKAVTPDGPRRRALYAFQRQVVFGPPRPADQRVLAALRRRYRDEVVATSEYLGRDLVTLWGYDEL